jgi:toxin ParE1/3/4
MAEYRISEVAREDLIRIYSYGLKTFGEKQAEKYYDSFFKYFDIIALRPYSFEAVKFIKPGYRRCVSGSDSIYFRINDDGNVDIMTIVGKQDISNIE